MNEMKKKFGKNFITVGLITLLHFGVWMRFTFSFYGFDISEIIMFVVVFVMPTAIGSIFSIIFLPKVYLITISQLLFIVIVYSSKIYIDNKNIKILTILLEWLAIINILSVIIVVGIKSIHKLILKIYRNKNIDNEIS